MFGKQHERRLGVVRFVYGVLECTQLPSDAIAKGQVVFDVENVHGKRYSVTDPGIMGTDLAASCASYSS